MCKNSLVKLVTKGPFLRRFVLRTEGSPTPRTEQFYCTIVTEENVFYQHQLSLTPCLCQFICLRVRSFHTLALDPLPLNSFKPIYSPILWFRVVLECISLCIGLFDRFWDVGLKMRLTWQDLQNRNITRKRLKVVIVHCILEIIEKLYFEGNSKQKKKWAKCQFRLC